MLIEARSLPVTCQLASAIGGFSDSSSYLLGHHSHEGLEYCTVVMCS